jgi:hypothetical protein
MSKIILNVIYGHKLRYKRGNIMKRITLSAFIVLALISIDVTISMAYAKSNVTIFKVTKVSTKSKLQLRAWPSPKSRVKVSLPFNAIDLTETGKKKILGKTKWLEVHWKDNRGWVNARYLVKTGVLPNRSSENNAVASSSRNIQSVRKSAKTVAKRVIKKTPTIRRAPINAMPRMPAAGNRYSQPTQLAAREVKTAYSGEIDPGKDSNKILSCIGSSPQQWNIQMNLGNKTMRVKSKSQSAFYLPINYHKWASPREVRLNIGGDKGRNIVDVNLEKTDACSTGLSRKNYMYEVNATINRDFYSGCCETVSQ